MIDAHPQIGISRATYWIPSWFEQRRGLTPDGFVTPALISKLLAYRKFSKMNIDRSELEALLASEEPMPYSRFVSGIFDTWLRPPPFHAARSVAYGSIHPLDSGRT
jgi:hypothetical protein